MSDKTEKSKKLKKIIQQQKKQNNETPRPTPEVNQEQQNRDIRIPINLRFLESINDILLLANSRVSWRPQELIPVGMILKDLDEIIGFYNNQIEEKIKNEKNEKQD